MCVREREREVARGRSVGERDLFRSVREGEREREKWLFREGRKTEMCKSDEKERSKI